MHRPLYQFAGTIKRDWSDMPADVKEIVQDFFNEDQINSDNREKVLMFLHKARKWRGDIAEDTKKQLSKLARQQVF